MTTSAVTFYSSSNSDRWQLITNVETGHKVVRHEPNLSSGGRTSEIGVPEFLSRSGASLKPRPCRPFSTKGARVTRRMSRNSQPCATSFSLRISAAKKWDGTVARLEPMHYPLAMSLSSTSIRRLGPGDVPLLRKLNALFGAAFSDRETYEGAPPTDAYLEGLLTKEHVITIVALEGGDVLGGLVAYELDKFERMRREVYIYDLAVDAGHRRNGIATALIGHLRATAAQRGAWVVYVQADYGDDPAIALYQKLGTSEEVLHFDIPI
jgi:aminoglycoside 3-N-acetyltransferase I